MFTALCTFLLLKWPKTTIFLGMIKVEKMIERYSIFETSTFELTLSGIFHVHCWDISSRRWALHFSYWNLFILLMNIPSPKLRRFKLEKLKCLLWSVLKSWKQGNYCRLLCFFKKKHFFIVFGVKLTPSNFQSLWKWTSFRNQQVLCIKYIF